jgi:hypothetical protein
MKQMEKTEQIKLVEKKVADYLEINGSVTGIAHFSFDEKQTVIKTGTKILLAQWELTSCEDSFIDAFISDRLSKVFAIGSQTNLKALYFYYMLSYNIAAPHELFEE